MARGRKPSVNWEGMDINDWHIIKRIDNFRYLCRCKCGLEKPVSISNIRYNMSTKCVNCSRKKGREKKIQYLEFEIQRLKRLNGSKL